MSLSVTRVSTILLENAIRTFLFLLAALVVSLIFGLVVACVAIETLPCHWFGTGFEGACAYGALWTSIGIGLSAVVLSFAYLSYRLFRRRGSRTSTLAVKSRPPNSI